MGNGENKGCLWLGCGREILRELVMIAVCWCLVVCEIPQDDGNRRGFWLL